MTHTFHEGLDGYADGQILHDGCSECEDRGRDAARAIANLDSDRFRRAWKRAFDLRASRGAGVRDASVAELPLLDTLWIVQVQLERAGVPLTGKLPTGYDPM